MEREQIIKALECCLEDVANCNNCPYERYCDMHENNMLRDTLDLITSQEQDKEKLGLLIDEIVKEKRELFEENKRLTEENERLRAEAENQSILWKQHFESIYETAKETVRADTVRKMQERLKKRASAVVSSYANGEKVIIQYCISPQALDQIAKEIIENKIN